MSAKGETTWSSEGKKTQKTTFEPLPAGEYDLKLDTTYATVKVADPAKSNNFQPFPRVGGIAFHAIGTGKDGKKDRMVFNDFYVRIEPNDNGNIAVEAQNGLMGLARALGEEIKNAPTVSYDTGEGEAAITERVIDPAWVEQWLKNRDGRVVRARLRVVPKFGGGPDEKENKVAAFIEGSDTGTTETTTRTITKNGTGNGVTHDEDFLAATKKKTATTKTARR